ncbi:hypothetical protein D3C72_1424520 [compost metagenome]
MVRIFVVTFGGIQWDTGFILFLKTYFRGFLVRVHLNGERLGGAKHLEQERQFAETLGHGIAQERRFVRVDHLAQSAYLAAGIFNF